MTITTATTTATTTTIHNAAHTHAHINFQRRETTWKGHSRMMMMMMMRMDESWKYEELRETENSKSPIWIGKKKIKPYITLAWHWLCVMDISCSISTNTNIQKKNKFQYCHLIPGFQTSIIDRPGSFMNPSAMLSMCMCVCGGDDV